MRGRSERDDPPVELTAEQKRAELHKARDAAREGRGSVWRTAKSEYQRYRGAAGETYLDWPTWEAEYLRTYRRLRDIAKGQINPAKRRNPISGSSNQWGGMPPGGGTMGGL